MENLEAQCDHMNLKNICGKVKSSMEFPNLFSFKMIALLSPFSFLMFYCPIRREIFDLQSLWKKSTLWFNPLKASPWKYDFDSLVSTLQELRYIYWLWYIFHNFNSSMFAVPYLIIFELYAKNKKSPHISKVLIIFSPTI